MTPSPADDRIPESHFRALSLILRALEGLPHPWGLTGSLGQALQGLPLQPHDIDLQSDAAGARAIQERLRAYLTRPLEPRQTRLAYSLFGAAEVAGVEVEIIGDMRKRSPDGAPETPPDLPAVIRWVDWRGLRVPVLSLEYEAEAYARMERHARAAQIRAFLAASRSP